MRRMKRYLCRSLLSAQVVISCSCVAQSGTGHPAGTGHPGWKLVWADEFNYTGLPDPTKWTYETGYMRHHEKQYYTARRAENARAVNGMLVIEGRKDKVVNAAHVPGSDDWRKAPDSSTYTSACLRTLGKAAWTYGRIEVRAKLPAGQGVWPAIWTLLNDQPEVGGTQYGEIDIMEFVWQDSTKIHANAHWAGEKDIIKGDDDVEKITAGDSNGEIVVKEAYKGFHIYAVEWTPKKLDFYFDDHLYHTFNIDTAENAGRGVDNPFRKPHYLLLNMALGGAWGGELDDRILPQQYLIDYVRIYQKTKGAK